MNPTTRILQLDNMNVAFQMLEKAGIVVPFLNPSQIVDCNEKMVMGLLWALIYEFQIRPSLIKEKGKESNMNKSI